MPFEHCVNSTEIKFGFGHTHVDRNKLKLSSFIIKLRLLDDFLDFYKVFFSLPEVFKCLRRLFLSVVQTGDIIDEIKFEEDVFFNGQVGRYFALRFVNTV